MNEDENKDEVRSSIHMTGDQAERIKKSAKKDGRPWTRQLVRLAEEALDARGE